MLRYCPLGFTLLLMSCAIGWSADEVIFSGPQVGEKLPSLMAKGVFGDLADKEFDLIAKADGKPVALIFVHARTRPAFGLTNTIMRWAATRSEKGLASGVIYLTDDSTAAISWMRMVKKHLSENIDYCVSVDGVEGPGSYGLNRNVTLTVLVGEKGKVTANFAIVQPSLPSDGPKILKAIVDVTGGGKVPTIDELDSRKYAGRARMKRGAKQAKKEDPQVRTLLRAVINKQASEEEVRTAAAAVEKYVDANEDARREIGRIADSVVNSGKLANYGTPTAQETLRGWAKKYGNPSPDRKKKTER